MSLVQAPEAVVMIRPHHFRSNPETRWDNAFQMPAEGKDVAQQARGEFDTAVEKLRGAGVQVHVFEFVQAVVTDGGTLSIPRLSAVPMSGHGWLCLNAQTRQGRTIRPKHHQLPGVDSSMANSRFALHEPQSKVAR